MPSAFAVHAPNMRSRAVEEKRGDYTLQACSFLDPTSWSLMSRPMTWICLQLRCVHVCLARVEQEQAGLEEQVTHRNFW